MRLLVYGPAGAGKTTLALALGRRLAIPVHHLDAVFFRPGGAPKHLEDAVAETRRLAAGDAWVIEGNHGAALGIAAARADRIAVLRLGRWRSLARVARRRAWCPPELRDKGPGGGRQVLPLHLVRHILLVHPRIEPGHLETMRRTASGELRSFADPDGAARWLAP